MAKKKSANNRKLPQQDLQGLFEQAPALIARYKAAESEDRYQTFIKNSKEGIWRIELAEPIPTSLDISQQVDLMFERASLEEANDAMARMYGFESAESLIGVRLAELMVRDDPANTAYLRAFIKSGYNLSNVVSHEQDRNGNDKYFRNSLVGIIESGKLVRGWGTQQDVTKQLQAEEKLKASEQRLALALKASNMGTWEWDVKNNKLIWSPELKQIFGLQPSDKITYQKYIKMLHPGTAQKLETKIAHSLKTGESYKVEHKIIWPDGSVHWILGQGQAILKNGEAIRMIGTSMNIDEAKRNEKLKATNQALKIQRKELLSLNKSKDEFISLASHQLRTPATGVKQYIGMLLEGYGGELDKEQMHLLKVAYESNERQLEIIDDLLKVAHIDAGKVNLTKHETNLNTLLKNILEEQADTFKNRNQSVKFKPPEKPLVAVIDGQRIRMVLENIIDNASKYTPKGKRISVHLQEKNGFVEIHIADQGVGIPEEEMSQLFQKFTRIDNHLSTVVGGTGIGLYWAKKIVDLHEGKIEVSSRLDKGSTFTVILPKGTV
jgi:PAS domain S-box-containing protein